MLLLVPLQTLTPPVLAPPPMLAPPAEMPVVTILRRARESIEYGWAQGVGAERWSALDNCWVGCDLYDDRASRFCAFGAIGLAAGSMKAAEPILHLFMLANDVPNIPRWNDRWYRTRGSVLRAFDRAIRYAGSRPAA